MSGPGSAILHNFKGLDSADQFAANGFVLEPPDQGLCVGQLLGTKTVVEIINTVVGFYTPSGTLLAPVTDLNTFFGEPFTLNISDPRCLYDATTGSWFFSVVVYPNALFPNHTDLLVLNGTTGAESVYRLGTTFPHAQTGGCPCFGDQPKLGIDKNNVYIAVDQFNHPQTRETGEDLFALDKSDLVAQSASVREALYRNLRLGGLGVLGLQPAITNGSDVEYLVNSFPYLDAQELQPNPHDNRLGLWALSNTAAVGAGGVPRLTATIVHSEAYAAPVHALATNGRSLATFSNDARIDEAQFINGRLWTALDTAVSVAGDSVVRDGLAWFEIEPVLGSGGVISGGNFTDQGYIAARGLFLIYPSIATTASGATAIAFSITSRNVNPSAGYVLRPAGTTDFGDIHVTRTGPTPDKGFTCALGVPQECRWGDYSFAVPDPNGTDLWMAAETTVAKTTVQVFNGQRFRINWGTEVWAVSGS